MKKLILNRAPTLLFIGGCIAATAAIGITIVGLCAMWHEIMVAF